MNIFLLMQLLLVAILLVLLFARIQHDERELVDALAEVEANLASMGCTVKQIEPTVRGRYLRRYRMRYVCADGAERIRSVQLLRDGGGAVTETQWLDEALHEPV